MSEQNRKPEYKDYVNFLGTYKNGSTQFSENTSSNSAQGYRNYLETLKNKKHQSVQPTFGEKPLTNGNNSNTRHVLKKQNSIGKISQKFEQKPREEPVQSKPSVHIEKAESIRKVSEKFQISNSNGVKKFETKVDSPLPPLPPNSKPKTYCTKIEIRPVVENIREKPPILSPKPLIIKQFDLEINLNKNNEQNIIKIVPPPLPAVLPPPNQASSENKTVVDSFDSKAPLPPPPPPPLPPPNFSNKIQQEKIVIKPVKITVSNGINNDKIDGAKKSATIDRNDPRVNKAVYGALRNMYGNYHDKANDYLATLPKNRVRKNNGLDQIINSIAMNGGLENLTGRANPNLDKE